MLDDDDDSFLLARNLAAWFAFLNNVGMGGALNLGSVPKSKSER